MPKNFDRSSTNDMEVNWHDGSGLIMKGNHYYHAQLFPKALVYYGRALEEELAAKINDRLTLWNIYNRLCATYGKLEDFENALRTADEMIRLAPENPKVLFR